MGTLFQRGTTIEVRTDSGPENLPAGWATHPGAAVERSMRLSSAMSPATNPGASQLEDGPGQTGNRDQEERQSSAITATAPASTVPLKRPPLTRSVPAASTEADERE